MCAAARAEDGWLLVDALQSSAWWHSPGGVELLRSALSSLDLAERPVVVLLAEQGGDLASRKRALA